MKGKQFWIEKLDLEQHPEGGYYRETYRSPLEIELSTIDRSLNGKRNLSTGIYFLLDHTSFSAFHRIKSDELWHFYDGDPITIHVIHSDGTYQRQELGREIEKGQQLQFLVPANSWFASEVHEGREYALVGCTVSFGFDFEDFEMADLSLVNQYPKHEVILRRLIRT